MAEEEEEERQEGDEEAPPPPPPPPKKGSALRYLPLVLVILLLQAAGGYYLVRWQLSRGDEPLVEADESGRVRTLPEGDEPEASVDLGEIVVNPRASAARLFLVTQVTVAVGPAAAADEIEMENNLDRVKDQVIAALSGASPQQLRSRSGRETVKDEIKLRLNEFLYDGQVMEVYFPSFYMQANSGYFEEN